MAILIAMKRVSVDIGGTFTDCFVAWNDCYVEGKALTTHHNLALGFNEALADACRWIGENMLAAVNAGHTTLDAVHLPEGLLGWITRIAQCLALATKRAASERNEE